MSDAAAVVAALTRRGQTVATSESLTGGLVGAAITSVPGASAVYVGGVVAYATRLKTALLGVPEDVIDAYSVISPQTATRMAAGVRELTGADWGIATTGVAGPDPQDGHAPGEVWIGLAGPGGETTAQGFRFDGGRDDVRAQTVAAALALLGEALDAKDSLGGVVNGADARLGASSASQDHTEVVS